jgi:hypothetical protein
MFFVLLVGTFLISLLVCFLTALVFAKPVQKILSGILSDDLSDAWLHFLKFVIYVVGIGGGVHIFSLEKYIGAEASKTPELTAEKLALEVYRSVIGSLQAIAWMLFLFFICALVAYVIVKVAERKNHD